MAMPFLKKRSTPQLSVLLRLCLLGNGCFDDLGFASSNMSPFFSSQNTLLQQLGVAPFSEGPWPLYIHPQSLSVLSRLLLIWQHKANAQGDPDVPECLKVWER